MQKKKVFSEVDAWHFFVMILLGLHYLHGKNIVHRDLKPANILVDDLKPLDKANATAIAKGLQILKIGDFGISKVDLQTMRINQSTLGFLSTPAYTAPEVIGRQKPSEKVDIWALGIIFHEMITGNNPFRHDNVWAMSDAIKNDPLKPLPDTVSPSIRGIIAKLLDKNPQTRPNTSTLLKVNVIKFQVLKLIGRIHQVNQTIAEQVKASITQSLPNYFQKKITSASEVVFTQKPVINPVVKLEVTK